MRNTLLGEQGATSPQWRTIGGGFVAVVEPGSGGLACKVASPSLTVCRVLPHEVTAWDVLLGVLVVGLFITLFGMACTWLDARTRSPRVTRAAAPEVVPFIHFPRRDPPEDEIS